MKTFLPLFALLLLAGCVNLQPVPDNSRYHILDHNPVPNEKKLNLQSTTPSLHFAQVDLPAYHDGKKLALRKSPTEIQFSELHRWVEPLEDSISRVLTSHLRNRLSSNWTFSSYPGRRSNSRGYEFQLSFSRVEGDSLGKAVIEGQIRLFQTTPVPNLKTQKHFKFDRIWRNKDTAELPKLLSELMRELGDELLITLEEAI